MNEYEKIKVYLAVIVLDGFPLNITKDQIATFLNDNFEHVDELFVKLTTNNLLFKDEQDNYKINITIDNALNIISCYPDQYIKLIEEAIINPNNVKKPINRE